MSLTKAALFAVLVTLSGAAAASRPPVGGPGGQATNRPPSVKLSSTTDRVVIADGCAEPPVAACTATGSTVGLLAEAGDPDGNVVTRYAYSTTGGRIVGDGREVTLDLTGIAPGTYKVTVKVDDGRGGTASDTATVRVERCTCDPPPSPPRPCPTVTVSCPATPERDGRLVFKANVSGGDPNVTPTFKWTVSAGTIESGQGTNSITVDASWAASNSSVAATADVGGYDRSCQTVAICTLQPGLAPLSRKVDEYGDVKLKDEWARLDSFAAELRNDPTAQGYFVCYGGRRSTAGEAQRRCDRALKYTSRYPWAADPARLLTVDAGYRCEPLVELWLVPPGAEPPADAPLTIPEPKPSASECRPPRRPARL